LQSEPSLTHREAVAHLQGITFELGTTVAEALDTLLADAQTAYASTLPKRATGPANSVVLFSRDMQWSDFVAALVRADVSRCVWIYELCTWDTGDERRDQAALVTGVIELVLPSWVNIERLWTPDNCAASRVAGTVFVFHMSARCERDLAKAMVNGQPQSFYDRLLAPQVGVMGAPALRALASWLRGVMDDVVLCQMDSRAVNMLLGQVACASGDFDTAKTYFEAVGDHGALANVYHKSGRLRDARDILLEATKDGQDIAAALQLARVLFDQGQCEEAMGVVESVVARSQPQVECFVLLAKLHDVLSNTAVAVDCARAALRLARDKGDALQIADVLVQLGRHALDELNLPGKALEHLAEALVTYKAVFGDRHAKSLACEQLLARAHQANGDAASAVASLRHVNEVHRLLFGPEHAKTLATSTLFASALLMGGWAAEGTAELERLHRSQVALHGAESDTAAKTLKRIARLKVKAELVSGCT